MLISQSARPARRRTRLATSIAVVALALVAVVVHQSSATSNSALTAPFSMTTIGQRLQDKLHGSHHIASVSDGVVPDGVTVFDDVPAVTRLDPALRGALRRAATDADGDGVEILVHSGWRSRAYQEELLDEAVARYGSRAAAARWVATPDTSPHVSGKAVDLGPSDATAWLSAHGAAYGLCRIYDNEPWHYELRPDAVGHGCPPRYADAAHDPRMRR